MALAVSVGEEEGGSTVTVQKGELKLCSHALLSAKELMTPTGRNLPSPNTSMGGTGTESVG